MQERRCPRRSRMLGHWPMNFVELISTSTSRRTSTSKICKMRSRPLPARSPRWHQRRCGAGRHAPRGRESKDYLTRCCSKKPIRAPLPSVSRGACPDRCASRHACFIFHCARPGDRRKFWREQSFRRRTDQGAAFSELDRRGYFQPRPHWRISRLQ